jgi:protein-export membrane protein SecD
MDRNLWIRLGVIGVVFAVAAYLLLPTYRYFGKYAQLTSEQVQQLTDAERRTYQSTLERAMKLGLDLRGGMHVVLELDESKRKLENKADAQDRVLEILDTRVNRFGVNEASMSKQGDSRIVIQLPGVDDPERVRGIIQQTAQLQFRMAREPQEVMEALQRIDAVVKEDAPETPPPAPAATPDGGPVIGPAPGDSAAMAAARRDSLFPDLAQPVPPTASATNPDAPFSSLFVDFRAGALFVPDDGARVQRIDALLQRPDVKRVIPSGTEFLWSSEEGPRTQDGLPTKMLYLVSQRAELTGDRLEDAHVAPDPDRPGGQHIAFRLDRRGARTFARVTEENVNKQLAIVLDNVVKSAPNIQGKIPSGEGVIQGSFSDAEARDLALVLRAGALPVDLKFVEERTVGPTLGADSLSRGLRASLIGLGLSILFLIVYYKLSGALAAVGLALNMVIVLAAMAVLGASLSLPGIAGLVLSVAMAVDANVLILERIREELRKNKTVVSAVEAGYKNALSAIIDSNLTTLFAGIVLMYFGTGPVKGFAVTLVIGIVASLFTALFVTRFVYDALTRHRKVARLSI